MRLGTRLATAFALVAVVVAATVGALSYQAAAFRITAEIDRSLQATTTAIASGQEAVLDEPVFDLRTVYREGRPIPADQTQQLAAQRIAADGSVHHVGGREVALPVGDAERGLAQRAARGATTTEVTIGDETYRVLTTALGDTEVEDDGDSSGRGALQVAVDIDGSRRVLDDLAMEILAVSMVVALVAGLAGWLLARRIARRLVRLTEVTEQVAAGGPGEYDEPADRTSGRDEIARLSSSFRTMLSRLTEARETQERLVQDAAHELRTPLTSLRTNARVLRRIDDLSPSSREKLVADVDGETRELSALVDELVALALTRGAVEPEEDLSLHEIAERVAERVARRSGREVSLHGDSSTVRGRRTALERAVGNLIENAAKFDGAGSAPIEVEVSAGTVTVADRGPGIADELVPRVFDRFYRAEAARALPGSGLGLAIVRDVALGHDGEVFARSRPGGGAVVGFSVGRDRLLPDSHLRHVSTSPDRATVESSEPTSGERSGDGGDPGRRGDGPAGDRTGSASAPRSTR